MRHDGLIEKLNFRVERYNASKFTLQFLKPKMMSPGPKRTTGRPKLERWKVFADVKFKRTKMICSICRQVGHNRETCSNYPVQKQ